MITTEIRAHCGGGTDPHLDGSGREVEVEAAQEALAREALVGGHVAQAGVRGRQERVLALPRRLRQLVPLFQLYDMSEVIIFIQ